ncbi:hypothetical protein ACWF50_23340 [Brucella pseudogrignonensis]
MSQQIVRDYWRRERSERSRPEAGELRGSDRLIDRFGSAGAERKAALQSVPVALAAIRKAETVYTIALSTQLSVEQSRRRRMATGPLYRA